MYVAFLLSLLLKVLGAALGSPGWLWLDRSPSHLDHDQLVASMGTFVWLHFDIGSSRGHRSTYDVRSPWIPNASIYPRVAGSRRVGEGSFPLLGGGLRCMLNLV